jgi:hypothetical protein
VVRIPCAALTVTVSNRDSARDAARGHIRDANEGTS